MLDPTIYTHDPAPKPGTFTVSCCECRAPIGSTACEITATSPHHCEPCHRADLDKVAANNPEPSTNKAN